MHHGRDHKPGASEGQTKQQRTKEDPRTMFVEKISSELQLSAED